MENYTNNEFEDIIVYTIKILSTNNLKFEIAQEVLDIFPEDQKPVNIGKELVSRLLGKKRNLPKKYYLGISDEKNKEQFFKNLLSILNQCEQEDSQKISEISAFIQDNCKASIFNNGNNVDYIVFALREKLEDRLFEINNTVRLYKTNLRKREYFFGRKDELFELSETIKSNGYAILSGEPGIGKTEIALKYANLHSKEYTNTLRVPYQGSLQATMIYTIKQCSSNKELADMPNAYNISVQIVNRLGQKLLIIIDGMNEDFINNISFKDEFRKYRFHLIITTRSRVENAIVVPKLPFVYCKKILEKLECINCLNEENQGIISSSFNPFLYAIASLEEKHIREKNEIEYSFMPYDYLGKQHLSHRAWLNRLYAFKKMSEEEQHVLKFLSVFTTNNYTFIFINSICDMCTANRIERLVNLGWINYAGENVLGEICYANANSWWQYYAYQYLDSSEFEHEKLRIMKQYNRDFSDSGKIPYNLEHYGWLADKIEGSSQEWNDYRNKVAEQLLRANPILAYKIMVHTGTNLAYTALEAQKLWNQLSKETSPSFIEYSNNLFNQDQESILKIRQFSVSHLSERLKNDLMIIKDRAEQSLRCLLFNEFNPALHYNDEVKQVVGCYISVSNLTEPFESNFYSLNAFIEKVKQIDQLEENPIYKNLQSFCLKNRVEMPDNEDIQELIDLMPMVQMLMVTNQLVETVCLRNMGSLIDGFITRCFQYMNNIYGFNKYPKFRSLFYDVIAFCYIQRNAMVNAEKCLEKANNITSECDSDIDKILHPIISATLSQEIKIFRFILSKSNDVLEKELIGYIDKCIMEVPDYNGCFRPIISLLLYLFAFNKSIGYLQNNLVMMLFSNTIGNTTTLTNVEFTDIDFSAVLEEINNCQPGS